MSMESIDFVGESGMRTQFYTNFSLCFCLVEGGDKAGLIQLIPAER